MIKLILALNLAIIAVLVFIFADQMVSPGKLIYDHRASESDCFACHTVFFGASSEKCISCHKVADIGVITTKGVPVADKKVKVPFHQKLLEQDCVACHSDHAGVAKYRIRHQFSHKLVDPLVREKCASCHQKPSDPIHRQVSDTCSQCHTTDKWKPATFDHNLLKKAEREKCVTCHKAKVPSDKFHRQVSDKCGQCHTIKKWSPSTFDHKKFFVFDRDHDVKCTICHSTDDYKKYTCYGCHEHSPEKVREEHWEEGISDYENCVACHRSADEDEAKRAWRSIKRGTPYQFDLPSEKNDKEKREKRDDDD
jgi:hypothetical protein